MTKTELLPIQPKVLPEFDEPETASVLNYSHAIENHLAPVTTKNVEVLSSDETVGGVPVVRVGVQDRYEPKTDTEMLDRDNVRSAIATIEQLLRDDDPLVVEMGLAMGGELLDTNPTVLAWKEMMTTAMALHPLQQPYVETLLDDDKTAIDDDARKLFLYGQEATIIRSRGTIFNWLMSSRDGKMDTGIALGGGAAVPECDAISAMSHQPFMTYVDMDMRALKHVHETARESGIADNTYEIVQAHLLKDFLFAKEPHPKMQNESYDMADLLGVIDYFSKATASKLLSKAYELVRPGGVLIFSNMLDENPTLKFNQQVVEWPGVIPFSMSDLADIITTVAPAQQGTIFVPEDHGYGVVMIEKPAIGRSVKQSMGELALSPR